MVAGDQVFEIIGIVGDIRHHSLEAQPFAAMYMPTYATGGTNVVLRTQGDPTTLPPQCGKKCRQSIPISP